MRALSILLAACGLGSASAAQVHFVDASASGANDGGSWANAYVALQDALASAQPGEAIWVRAGSYAPDQGAGQSTGDRDASFELVDGVELYGGFAGTETNLSERAGLFGSTLLTGDLLGDDLVLGTLDNSRHVLRASAVGASTVLDGFTIEAGLADGAIPRGAGLLVTGGAPSLANLLFRTHVSREAGAALELDGSDASLQACDFIGNTVKRLGATGTARGGGVHVQGGTPSFVDCEFITNGVTIEEGSGFAQGGALYAFGSNLSLVDCTFIANSAYLTLGGGFGQGGALYLTDGSDASLLRCVFIDNRAISLAFGEGGALVARFGSDPTLTHCSFVQNRASGLGYGGAAYVRDDADPHFVGCLFNGNEATAEGGALYAWDEFCEPALTNCTLFANTAGSLGGGLRFRKASAAVARNSILWANSDAGGATESAQSDGGLPSFDHCCVEGWSGALAGGSTHGLDPLFVDAAGLDLLPGTLDDDLRPGPFSPCVDAGDTTALLADAFDLDDDLDTLEPLSLDLLGSERLLDDVTVPDTGVGSPPVDMGAFERMPQTFFGDIASFSVASGGTQVLTLGLGPDHAFETYFVIGTTSGTFPGIPLDDMLIPLNFDDYMNVLLLSGGGPPLSGALGLLDAAGTGTALWSAPGGLTPNLVGVTFHHAYLSFFLGQKLILTHVSNPVALLATP